MIDLKIGESDILLVQYIVLKYNRKYDAIHIS